MENKVIYILHKSGAKNHYTGLAHLCQQKGYQVKYREFSVVSTLFKSLFKLKFDLFWKQWINAWFLLNLNSTQNQKIILGIAPYDYKLTGLLKKLRNHQIYYHTSWTCWDGSFYPNKKKVTPQLIELWKTFIEQKTQHIFAVSNETKIELEKNYNLPNDHISVVYHSLDATKFNANQSKQNNRSPLQFIYAGRLIPQKGLEELLEHFAQYPHQKLVIAGKGNLKSTIEQFANQHPNIEFLGQISDQSMLAKHFGESHYLLLNSHKSGKWEELFGMVIIEAMACGAIPITTKHTGPKEIIQNQINGFLVEEGQMIDFIADLTLDNYNQEIQQNAIKSAQNYSLEKISQRWLSAFKN